MTSDLEALGTAGCVGMHTGQSHAAHMDALDRRQNAALLEAAVERGGPGKPFAENALAWLLLGRLAEVEQIRLAAKGVWLAREGQALLTRIVLAEQQEREARRCP